MPWFKVDENLLTHPKFIGLSDGAVALWLRAGIWSASALTNGDVPRHALRTLAERGDDSADELVERGLWERSKLGFRFHDWNDYQPSPEHVAEIRELRKAAGRKGGLAKGYKQNAKQIGKQNSSSGLAKPKQPPSKTLSPIPIPNTEPSLRSGSAAPNIEAGDTELRPTQRSKRITDAYAEIEPMCKWPAINGVVLHAIKIGKWTDEEIEAAVIRLAKDGRTVTIESLRIELQGFAPRINGTTRSDGRYQNAIWDDKTKVEL